MSELPRAITVALVALSAAMFVGSVLAIPRVIRSLPADHFVRPPQPRSLAAKALRNGAGALLVAIGIAMLVLPGQGLLAILFGLSIMDLQLKHKVLRSILARPRVQEIVQRIRASAGKPPLVVPEQPVT